MNAWKGKGAKTPVVRVYDKAGTAHVRTLGTQEYPELESQVSQFIQTLRKQKRWAVLNAIIKRDLTACQAYRFDIAGTLDVQLATRAELRKAKESEASDVDLSPLVDTFVSNEKYRSQIRKLIPQGVRFPQSRFTRATVSAFIRDLRVVSQADETVSRPAKVRTKRNHKAALSVFGEALVEADVIELNPVKQVKGMKLTRKDRRIRFLEPQETRKLVESLPDKQRALEALMAGSGMEWQSCMSLRRRDIDLDTRIVFAAGNKNEYRERYVEVTEDWAWEVVKAHVAQMLPDAKVFNVSESSALQTHQRRCKEFGFPRTTLHQHRHGFAVMHLKRDCDLQWLKNQLGHAPQSTLAITTYGVYINAKKLTARQAERMGQAEVTDNAQKHTASNRASSARNDFNSKVSKGA